LIAHFLRINHFKPLFQNVFEWKNESVTLIFSNLPATQYHIAVVSNRAMSEPMSARDRAWALLKKHAEARDAETRAAETHAAETRAADEKARRVADEQARRAAEERAPVVRRAWD
jgi:hypothetical protein